MDEAPQVNDAGEAFSIDMTSIPSGNQLNNHDQNVDKALLLFYENAYSPLHDHIHDLNHESNNESEDVPTRAEDRFLTSLDELKITSVKQREMQCKFNSIHDRKARIIGCCSCGISCTLPTVSSEGHLLPPPNLKDFPGHAMFRPLQFKAEELEEWNAQSSNQQMIRSTKLSATDGVRYHVHQELIIITPMQNEDDSITSTMKGYICKQCENYLSRRIVPMFSVAKLDLGLLSRVFEHDLYPIEKLLVSRHRPLAVTLKLSCGGSGHDGIIGHMITFAHRGPESFLSVLPTIDNDLINRIQVTFVGRRGMPEDVATFLRHCPAATVRPSIVIQYLRLMTEVNPGYGDLEINDSPQNLAAMASLPSQLFDTRQVITDDTIVEIDRLAVANLALAVNNPNMQPLVVPQKILRKYLWIMSF